jgi:hypothetical protein
MTLGDAFIAGMRRRCEEQPDTRWSIAQDDIDQYTGGDITKEVAFYNQAAATLAKGFQAGTLSFEFCDIVANELYGTLIAGQSREPQPPWPDIFYDVFLAFDEGEYQHRDDGADVDPVEAYTRPMIARLLGEL